VRSLAAIAALVTALSASACGTSPASDPSGTTFAGTTGNEAPVASASASEAGARAGSSLPTRPDDPTRPPTGREPVDVGPLPTLLEEAVELTGSSGEYDRLMEAVGDARFVLIGEASHGTHEFYRERAEITQRLIEEEGFDAVVAEADWPDAYRLDQYAQGEEQDADFEQASRGFDRFPAWMWRNEVVAGFVDWLRDRNAAVRTDARAHFYGMDMYSLYRSIDEVVRHLDEVDAEAARQARERYGCFEGRGEDPAAYGSAAARDESRSCEDEAAEQLDAMDRLAAGADADTPAGEARFSAERNAAVVAAAEAYFRVSAAGTESGWNLRDTHMWEMLRAISEHLGRGDDPARLVVWAHNSHVGDARATRIGQGGEINVGQLVREAHPEETLIVGFSTYEGTVLAARGWEQPGEVQGVRRALNDSYEALFHEVAQGGPDNFVLDLRAGQPAAEALTAQRLERAIGVVYAPATERWSHYFEATLPEQFDFLIHLDTTTAVTPLPPVPAP
jgi:erythromycin esterase-like protein